MSRFAPANDDWFRFLPSGNTAERPRILRALEAQGIRAYWSPVGQGTLYCVPADVSVTTADGPVLPSGGDRTGWSMYQHPDPAWLAIATWRSASDLDVLGDTPQTVRAPDRPFRR